MTKEEKLIELFSKAPMKKTFNMELSYKDNEAHFHMKFDKKFDHTMAGTHGGVVATILDNVGWFAAALNYDTWIATSNISVNYLKQSVNSDLFAVGKTVKSGKNIAYTYMEVKDDKAELIAYASGSFAVSKKPI